MKAAISSAERRLFEAIWSYRVDAPRSELHARGLASGEVVDFEVLPLLEAEHAGEHVGGERLDLGVQTLDGVVVELPGVGDAAFRAGELLLQVQEVGVRLELGIRL